MSTPVSQRDTIVIVDEHTTFAAAVPQVAAEAVRHRLLGSDSRADEVTAKVTAGDTETAAALGRQGATFVTLTNDGKLRGCIGTLLARRSLGADIVHNAQAATKDPRLPPVECHEWPDLTISVSVLTKPAALDVADRAGLLAVLRPGVDGVTLRRGARRATFLPSVWDSLTDPEEFVSRLLRKGGWEPQGWPEGLTVEVYQADHYTSPSPRPALEET